MADHDRIVPWFPDVDLDEAAAARAPRPAARPLGARRRPAAASEAPARPAGGLAPAGAAGYARRDGLADAPGGGHGPAGEHGPAGDDADLDYSLAGRGLVDVPGEGDDAPPAAPAGYGGPAAGGPGALRPALPPAGRPVPAPGPPGAPAGPAGWPGGAVAAEPLDPRVAARRFAELLADEDRARGEHEARLRAGRDESLARAETYRDTAAEIRGQVRRVWRQVSETLAPFGVDDLEQVRGHEPAAGALPGIGLDDGPARRRSLPARGGDRDGRATAPQARRAPAAGPAGLLPAPGAAAAGGADDDSPLDVAAEVEQARRLWMRALATAAELRGVQRASSSLSVGLVTAGACVLVALLAGAARMFLDTGGLPCLAAGLIAGAALVSVATDGGAKAAVRSALLSAGVAGAVVLATARAAPTEPAAIVLSLASLAAAVRFGLGFGASKPEQPAPGAPARRRR